MYKVRLNTRQRSAPPEVAARVSLQNASTLGWDRYVGRRGTIIGMRRPRSQHHDDPNQSARRQGGTAVVTRQRGETGHRIHSSWGARRAGQARPPRQHCTPPSVPGQSDRVICRV